MDISWNNPFAIDEPQDIEESIVFHSKEELQAYYETPRWREELRPAAMKRDGWKCQNCGNEFNLRVHHIRYPKILGTETIDDLVTLCEKCHQKVHSPWNHEEYREGLSNLADNLIRTTEYDVRQKSKVLASIYARTYMKFDLSAYFNDGEKEDIYDAPGRRIHERGLEIVRKYPVIFNGDVPYGFLDAAHKIVFEWRVQRFARFVKEYSEKHCGNLYGVHSAFEKATYPLGSGARKRIRKAYESGEYTRFPDFLED